MTAAVETEADQHRHTTRDWKPDAALAFTLLIWASTFLVTKELFTHISVFAYMAVRFALMTVLAFIVLWFTVRRTRGQRWTPHRSDWPRIVAAGLMGFTLNGLGFNIGVDLTSVFSAAFLNATAPLFTILFLAFIGERSPLIAWVGVVIATVGVGIFLFDQSGGERSLLGDFLCIASAAAFALYAIWVRPLTRTYSGPLTTAWTLLAGSIPLVLVGLPASIEQNWSTLPTESWIALAYMIVFPIYVAFTLFHFTVQHRGAAFTSSFILLVPVLSGLLATLFYSDPFGPTKLLGAALILLGLFLLGTRRGHG
jgi:drug/metabolite transporter (DMT)-like permease